ncbi:hypothetical protein FSP39_002746 [Pinctada imbricata]|uniref:CRAL-TRIO domain-containing protein n=1 Tax=Pinctada imbricata TaxID=66713 RepID=A0AA88YPK1_PINIB|nr:hypothetical protein FSP39_002746 [Pinctada imbricata]
MVDMIELMTCHKSVAFLLALHNGCSDQKITLIIQAIQSLEARNYSLNYSLFIDRKGTVAVLYIVKPKLSTKRKLLKKLLGIKRLKDSKSVSEFKTVMVSSISELYRHIDKTNLNEDLGGTIQYRHDAFINLHSILPCVAVGEDVLDRLQDVRDKVHLLREYDLHDKTSQQLVSLREELHEKYCYLDQVRFNESDIVPTIERCKQALHTLELSSVDRKFDGLLPPLVSGVEVHIKAIYTSLVQTHSELSGVWAIVEKEVAEEVSIKHTNEEAEQICMDITEYFWPNMSQHPKVGENLYQAKTFRREFLMNIYEPAKELLERATLILQKLQQSHHQGVSGRTGVRDLVIRLSRSIHPFASRLNVINKSYVSVHQHFLLYNKVATWYNKTIAFLPNSLFESCQQSQSTVSFIPAPQGWRQVTRKFLHDNPTPKEEILHSLDSCSETASSRNIKLLVQQKKSLSFPNNRDVNNLDSLLDYISNVTSSKGISKNKKLQYISDAISMLDLTSHDENVNENDDSDLNHNYFYGDEWLRAFSYESISHSGISDADAIADMSDRLWKSVDDVSLHSRGNYSDNAVNLDQYAGSLNELSTNDKERCLWQEVESRQPIKTDSKASLGTCDADVSSRSNDDTDDIDSAAPILRRDRPSRQNIRRKRYQ